MLSRLAQLEALGAWVVFLSPDPPAGGRTGPLGEVQMRAFGGAATEPPHTVARLRTTIQRLVIPRRGH